MPWQGICHSSSLFFSLSVWLPGRLFLALKHSNFHEMSKARLIIFFLWPSCHLCHFSQLSSINVLPDWEEKGLFSVVGAECSPNSAITSNPASSLQCVWCTSVQALTHEVDVLDGPQIVLMYYNNLCFCQPCQALLSTPAPPPTCLPLPVPSTFTPPLLLFCLHHPILSNVHQLRSLCNGRLPSHSSCRSGLW